MENAVIISTTRTAIGKYGKTLNGMKVTQLGAAVVEDAIKKAGIKATDVEECIMGNVLSTGLGQNPARQSAIAAGIPVEVGSYTVNDVCGSGLKSIMNAADAIKAGEYNVIAAGGMESMSNVPYILNGVRWGLKMNDQPMVDAMVHDGLWDIFNNQHMGFTGEIVAERFGVTREDSDRMAFESNAKAAKAQEEGRFDKEITPIVVRDRKGETVFNKDEGVRPETTMESLASLRPVFKKDGQVTAGNSSQLSDGAAACIVTSASWAEEHGIKPLAEIVAYGERGVAPELIMEAPIPTTRHVLKKAGMTIDDIDLFEHNEAFASASCAVKKDLGVPDEKFNVNGGAIALGHPIGCSGARVLTTLIHALHDRNKETGLATLCLGGGNAVTMIVRKH
ncbi:MAG: acetyl-CoA C-acetyltransferase [Euryarchaeota archaeon]|jgi:acetyl-CoA C-acetyltransferase|nr:acetyl-CoA C-acetyltransferase [Euryarchaeota archaeon]